jgi:ribose 5-phosphate isomerase B
MTTTTLSRCNGTIYLAADHAGFAHKEAVKAWLESEEYSVIDEGAFHYDPEDDFTDLIARAAIAVAEAPNARLGIIFGGSGQGEAMMANRFAGVRATVYYGGGDEIIKLSREHNDANVLSIGARFVSLEDTKRVIWDWLHLDPNPNEKYARRNRKLDILAPVRSTPPSHL